MLSVYEFRYIQSVLNMFVSIFVVFIEFEPFNKLKMFKFFYESKA